MSDNENLIKNNKRLIDSMLKNETSYAVKLVRNIRFCI
jgi:hypothetical protein